MAADEHQVDIEEFARLDLRVGTVREASGVEGADKLLVMKVDIGTEVRQVVAGISGSYMPDSLVGKKVVLLANLKEARIRGIESHGMILAADGPGGISIIRPEDDTDDGARVR